MTWNDVIKALASKVPRVGNLVVRPGDGWFDQAQMLVPEVQIKMVVFCRGAERFRPPPEPRVNKDVMPWRKTIVVDRNDGSVHDMGDPEQWSKLTKANQVRKSRPARMSISIFGIKADGGASSSGRNVLKGNPEESVDGAS